MTTKFNVNIADKYSESSLSEKLEKSIETITKQNIYAYQQMIESINYVAVITRSDVAFAASKLSKFLINSEKEHLQTAMNVLTYLIHIKNRCIVFETNDSDSKCSIFLVSSNASYADDSFIRYNSQKYCFRLYDDLID